ncbi:MAG: type II secretion system GspH family protein [Campylobacter sp.]|uniref:pilus assembly FimT family protein n=1 Tax=Campylobacter sp. TaxID=205 RepID=UPI002AA89FDF|nr:type II secretion system protein [Campylobacter sp.]MCI7023444.1 type II secretion system GspH family protein [Campylobacter sp.]
MKKAFTLIELVFVMVVLGILTFALWPKKQPTQAFEAARQIVAHIRYTQHLALNDDKFATHTDTDGTGNNIAIDWYKRLWRITFSNLEVVPPGCRNGGWRYAVYQNIAGDLSDGGQPNGTVEAASNPAQAGKVLSACYSGLSTNTSDELNLGQTYKIETIDFSQFATDSRIQGIIFDELGRAYPRGNWTTPYGNNNFSQGGGSYGRIRLGAKDGSRASILVFGETGYACVENVDPGCNP